MAKKLIICYDFGMKKKCPETPKLNTIENIHGIDVPDPYRWLEKNDDPKVKKWIKQQNSYTRSFLSNIPARNRIHERLNRLFETNSLEVPVSKNNNYFFVERKKSNNLGILYVKKGLRGKPKILIDPNRLSKNKTTILHSWYPSPNGELLAYCLSDSSNDQASIHILDVKKIKKLPDIIPDTVYTSPYFPIEWSRDNNGFWYNRGNLNAPKNERKFNQKIFYHQIGDNFKDDSLIFGDILSKEDLPWLKTSIDGRHLLITVHKFSKSEFTELYLYDNKNPKLGFIPVTKNKKAMFFGVLHSKKLYIRTNYNAPLWKIIAIDLNGSGLNIDNWKSIIPESEHKIENFKIIGDNIFVEILKNAHSTLKNYHLNGKFVREISLPTIGSITAISAEQEGSELFFNFSSFLIPHIIYRYNTTDKRITIFNKEKNVINIKQYTVKQLWCNSKDAENIPFFIIHKKNIKLNSNNPLLLYGYGGFGISMTPHFNRNIIPFLEKGGIYAIANIRGGGEFGEKWHKNGMLNKKQNCFNDFIATIEYLIKKHYTNPDKIAISGWSNGGLLTGAILAQRPDLIKVAVIGAPVLDMLRYHIYFGGRLWIPEYGDIKNKKMFKYLLSYSPYHNIKSDRPYPATMIITADNDDRVHPMHAYKMAAKLQKSNSSSAPIILRIETKAGHGGAAPIHRLIEQESDILSFIFYHLGL